jgi:beta-N-acetylhexosaminidase
MDAQRGIARRMVVGLPEGSLTPAWERDFADYPPAGVILFRHDFQDLESLRWLTAHLRTLARPRRIFVGMDEEGGFVSQLGGLLAVPPSAALLARGGEGGDVGWAARVTGERLRALGVDWVFAPVADVHSRPENPVIGPRAFGAEPSAVARAVAEALAGYRAMGIASCLKHFPGHGDTLLDSHLDLPRSEAPLEVLERRELLPFRENLGADSVMTAHVIVTALDPDRPGTFSPRVVRALLRRHLGFDGIVITDALEMQGAAAGRTPAEAGRLALEAGCDLLLFAHHREDVRRARLELARMLAGGGFDRSAFDDARTRLAEFDRRIAPPSHAELAKPVTTLTPEDWERRLAGIVERGLIVRGEWPPAAARGAWRVTEPEYPHGLSLAEELRRLGTPLAEQEAAAEVVAVMSRRPLPEQEIERLRALCRERPVALVGLQNDAFLERLPEAALRISAADATPLTRRVVAGRLVGERKEEVGTGAGSN